MGVLQLQVLLSGPVELPILAESGFYVRAGLQLFEDCRTKQNANTEFTSDTHGRTFDHV